jgi:hypothetical protein
MEFLSCSQGYTAPMPLGGEQAIRAAHGAGGSWSAMIRIQQLQYILFPAESPAASGDAPERDCNREEWGL